MGILPQASFDGLFSYLTSTISERQSRKIPLHVGKYHKVTAIVSLLSFNSKRLLLWMTLNRPTIY